MNNSVRLVRAGMLLVGSLLVAACASEETEEDHDDFGEQSPGEVGAGSEELVSSVSCKERSDTAYIKGESSSIKVITVGGKPVAKPTAHAFLKMQKAAHQAGVSLSISSGFRTMAEQKYFYNCYLTKKCNNGNLAAKPGYSNHQSGLALDLTTSSWLAKNASKYGFIRTVPSEDWHYEYTGGSKDPGGPCSGESTSVASSVSWLAPKADATIKRQDVVLQVKVTDAKVVAVKYYQGSLHFATATRADGFAATYDFKYSGDKTLTAVGVDASGEEIETATGNVDVSVL